MLEKVAGGPLHFERLAITEQQITDHGLTPIRKRDNRYKATGGWYEAVETEALSQKLILGIVNAIKCPIIQVPWAGEAKADLAGSVSKAGGPGSLN
jgi:hypothetical protein